ncbi:ABC-2 type transport system permease protein [Quadrisphaera granulorum]|uniref:ABC-2 type transport system permease protein n=1 Tax=Quadrisphaera granulorum TaxID=317664 RepID=A0A316AB24_9ACTN|nr:ABC transporter permease [Quadrisphaera granulorum]PWJ54054.1 ABC-2 type transport system permease protein [Quadrisphaera granulorum]SZE96511.1 ABC-2 type transport system permease protein [Quadrisphaera granulorum]
MTATAQATQTTPTTPTTPMRTTTTASARPDQPPAVRRPLVNPTYLRLELRRLLRNRRTLIFSVLLPVVFVLSFSGAQSDPQGKAYVAINFAVYGAMVAAAVTGAAVSIDRSSGWSRQLRLTPLRPTSQVVTKVLTALVLAALPVVVVLGVGALMGGRLSAGEWLGAAAAAWLGAIPFAGLGLAVGYLVPAETAMQVIGAGMSLLAMVGGLFVPLSVFGTTMRHLAALTPAWGPSVLARYSFAHEASVGAGVTSIIVWGVLFAAAAAWLFRRDTARV